VVRFNLPERVRTFARIAVLLGEDVEGIEPGEAAERAILAVEQLKRDTGIPERLRELGGTENRLPEFAEKAHAIHPLRWVNPRPSSRNDLLEILKSAF
jgi:alcohol dehydrogenase class IV